MEDWFADEWKYHYCNRTQKWCNFVFILEPRKFLHNYHPYLNEFRRVFLTCVAAASAAAFSPKHLNRDYFYYLQPSHDRVNRQNALFSVILVMFLAIAIYHVHQISWLTPFSVARKLLLNQAFWAYRCRVRPASRKVKLQFFGSWFIKMLYSCHWCVKKLSLEEFDGLNFTFEMRIVKFWQLSASTDVVSGKINAALHVIRRSHLSHHCFFL